MNPYPLLGDLAVVASLPEGPIAAQIAAAHWRWSLKNYQGAGR
jgi:ABC-2 type transport system permease protein